MIPGAGHVVNLDEPEAFDRAVLDFVGELSDDAGTQSGLARRR